MIALQSLYHQKDNFEILIYRAASIMPQNFCELIGLTNFEMQFQSMLLSSRDWVHTT